MAYTQAQLVAAYTAANNGVAPDAATTALLGAFAQQTATGQLSDNAALAYVINSADNDVSVAVQAYQFFTGKTPTKAGLDYLVNSTVNTNDLNDPYYAQFGLENRYINFAANLGVVGEGAAAFASTYGSMSFAQFVGVAYETIIGSSYAQAAGINVSAAIADVTSRQANFTAIARQAGIINSTSTTAQVDIATKAALIGYLMAEGIKADVGLYAAGANNFVNALINGTAQYNVDLRTVYSVMGGGTGSNVGGTAGTGTTYTLLTTPDNVPGTQGNDTINGYVNLNAGVVQATSTFNANDTIRAGGGGSDVLSILVDGTVANQATLTNVAGGAGTGATFNTQALQAGQVLPAADVSGIERIYIRNLATGGVASDQAATDTANSTVTTQTFVTVDASSFAGHKEIGSDRSTQTLVIRNLGSGAAAAILGNGGSTVNGALQFGYATATGAATLNLSGGTGGTGVGAVTITSTPASVTLNSTGQSSNTIGGFALGGSATALTVNATAGVTTGNITGFTGTAATITVAGSAANSATGAQAVNLGTIEANTVKSVDASGLTAGGVALTVSNNLQSFKGGAGNDLITTAAVTSTTAGIIDAGAGTGDIVNVAAAAHADTAAEAALYTNFEVLRVGGAFTQDASLFSTIGSIQLNNATAGVSGLTAAQASKVTVMTNTTGATVALANAAGLSDALTVTLQNGLSSTSTTSADFAGANINGFETLNVVSSTGSDTDKNAISFANAADLTAINVSGAVSAALTLTNTAKAVTVASTQTGSAALDVAGNAIRGSSITTTGNADTITLTAAVAGGAGDYVTYNAGAGDDAVSGTIAAINNTSGATASVKVDGGTGTDTLTLTDTTTTAVDANFQYVTGFEKLTFTGTGALSLTSGGFFDTNFKASGVTITNTSQTGNTATAIDLTSFTGNATVVSTNANATTANTTVVTGSGADNISVSATGTTTGAISVNAGAGNDSIAVTVAAALTSGTVTINGGAGQDAITLTGVNAADVALITFAINDGQSTLAAPDSITGYADGMKLEFDGTAAVAATVVSGAVTGYTSGELTYAVTNGLVTFAGTSAAGLSAAQKATIVQSVVTTANATAVFVDGADSYVFHDQGASDSLVKIVGVALTGVETTSANNTLVFVG